MRNSFNTAGFSEVVHEIRNDPAEAAFLYTAKARYSPFRGLSAKIGPALFGTVKSARAYSVELGDPTEGQAVDGPVPMDLALTGVASCALTTLVGGGSARGVVFDTVEMLLEYGDAVNCVIEVGGVADDEVMAHLVDQVQNFSPNFTTMTRPVPVHTEYVTGSDQDDIQEIGHTGRGDYRNSPAGCRVRWISSTQHEARSTGPGSDTVLRVDAPKQLTGVDWGPNPQEYLLMGLAADVAAQLGHFSRQLAGQPLAWEVVAQAKEDVRGLLQAEPDAVVQLQDVSCTVFAPPSVEAGPTLEKIVASAFAHSQVKDLISQPQAVDVSLRSCAREL